MEQDRKARTRTLIQIGGLVKLCGLMETCGIEEGDDLQHENDVDNRAPLLLGILIEAVQNLPSSPSQEDIEQWKTMGINALKLSAARKYYSH